jgi:hypothetical protein
MCDDRNKGTIMKLTASALMLYIVGHSVLGVRLKEIDALVAQRVERGVMRDTVNMYFGLVVDGALSFASEFGRHAVISFGPELRLEAQRILANYRSAR